MNNLKRILYTAGIMMCLLFLNPLRVKAEFMPPVLPDLQAVPDFLMMAGQYQMTNDARMIIERSDYDRLNQLVNGRTISQSMSNHYVDNANVGQLQLFYDSNGNLVNQDNTYTVFGTSDIIDYACVCDKTTGKILYSYDSNNNLYSTLTAGDVGFSDLFNDTSTSVGRDMYNFALNYAKQNGMVVYSNQATDEEIERLESYQYYAVWHTNQNDYTCYVPNACTEDTVVVANYGTYGNIDIQSDSTFWQLIWAYTNDPGEVIFSSSSKGNNFLVPGSFSWGGYHFNYANQDRDNGVNYFYQGGYIHANIPTPEQYSQYRVDSADAVYVQPSENTGNVTNIYNYTYTRPIQPQPIYNNNYDYSTKTTYNNYPVNNTYNFTETNPTTNNYYEEIVNYENTPNDDDSLGELDINQISNNIPIISNLQKRFPFSIPWDIANMFKSLSVPREAPVIDAEITFPVINYTWNCSLDLSMFDNEAELFRKCILILFIVGLAVYSYSHHFGS